MTVLEQIRRANVQVQLGVLEEAVRRIVDVADPERIILFGSAARGEVRPTSDLDLLVIKGGEYDYRGTITEIYAALAKLDTPVDVVLVTPEQAERYRNSFCLVIHPALKEGKPIYEREAVPAG
jgi:predicted nucleotidyltransferase